MQGRPPPVVGTVHINRKPQKRHPHALLARSLAHRRVKTSALKTRAGSAVLAPGRSGPVLPLPAAAEAVQLHGNVEGGCTGCALPLL